jgi:transposase-like protein
LATIRASATKASSGVADVLIAVVDGLGGFPEATTEAVCPQAQIQTCIVHLIRTSLNYVGWKDRKALAAELKAIYQAASADAAEAALTDFEQGAWGRKFPPIALAWRRQWTQVIPFFAYPAEVRKIIYTTNAIKSLHMRLRKIVKNRGHFPSDEAATKLLFLPRPAQYRQGLEDAAAHLEGSCQSVRHCLRRTVYGIIELKL